MQRNPRLSGLSGSPRTPTSLPSSTSASIPQSVGWQFIGHIVRTVRNDAMPAKDTGYRTQRSPAGEARRQSAYPIPSAGAEELRRDEDGQEDEHSERRKPVPHSPPAEWDQPVDDAAAVEWRNRQQIEQGHRQVDDGEADEQGLGCRMQRQGENAVRQSQCRPAQHGQDQVGYGSRCRGEQETRPHGDVGPEPRGIDWHWLRPAKGSPEEGQENGAHQIEMG